MLSFRKTTKTCALNRIATKVFLEHTAVVELVYEYDEKCTAGVAKSESSAKCHSVRMHDYLICNKYRHQY